MKMKIIKWIKNELKERKEYFENQKNCLHQIGENESKEVYLWKGRNPQPIHYVNYVCEGCGLWIHQLIKDQGMETKNEIYETKTT